MRSLLLLCALVVAVFLVCKPSNHFEVQPVAPQRVVAAVERAIVLEPTVQPVARPHLLSLLTLGAAVLGAVSTNAAESPLDANAQLAARIVETTAQLEASADRIADARVLVTTRPGSAAVR